MVYVQKKQTKLLGKSKSINNVFGLISKVALTDSTVLITGETGTGKELVAKAIHRNSPRMHNLFVPVNCGAIPSELIESELFGHEKGAFTHAIKTRVGRIETAEKGTVFLDEIGDLDFKLQVKLLRFLQEKEYERIGESKTRKANVRVIVATNKDLEKAVKDGTFREDLFYRLDVAAITLPPLRERDKDIILLADHFLHKHNKGKKKRLLPETCEFLLYYSWPGNVRELENYMERLCIFCNDEEIQPKHLPEKILKENDFNSRTKLEIKEEIKEAYKFEKTEVSEKIEFDWPLLRDMENKDMQLKEFLETIETNLILEALERVNGVKNQAASILGLKRTTLIEKLKYKKLV